MATAPFPNAWSAIPNLTGNSQFVVDANGAIWLVSTAPSGAMLFVSVDNGRSFSEVIALPGTGEGNTLGFDPALTFDAQGNLYIIGQTGVSQHIGVSSWVFNPTTSALQGPTLLTLGGLVPADYDIADSGDGGAVAVVCFLGSTEALTWFRIDPSTNTVSSRGVIEQSASMAGNRYGSVSLAPYSISKNTLGVLIHFTSHPKNVLFKDLTVSLQSCFWQAGTTSTPTVVFQFSARHLDNRLTVTPSADGTAFYLSDCFYTQQQSQLIGNILLGSFTPSANPQYNIVIINGTETASFLEPTLSVSPAGLVLAYLLADLTLGYQIDAPIQLVGVTPIFWRLTTRDDFPYAASARWLRGTKGVLPESIPWCFAAQRIDDTARVFSGYNSPPVVVLSPLSVTAQRGQVIEFDASQSFDVNLNALQFSWSVNDPTSLCTFESEGAAASLLIPYAVGPAQIQFTVTVQVTAVDENGNPLHPPVPVTSVITLPALAPPVIGLAGFGSPLSDPTTLAAASRNAAVQISPTITSQSSALTYSWQQTSGTTVDIVGSLTGPVLQFTTNGANIYGETLSFELIVSDQVNAPVVQDFDVPVAARVTDPEQRVLSSLARSGNIANRNTTADWGLPTSLGYITEFTKSKRGAYAPGNTSVIFIGPNSVLTETTEASYHAYTPNPNELVVDAVLDGSDVILVLVNSNAVLAFEPTGLDTDNAFSRIALTEFTNDTYTGLFATPQFANQRVIALSGANGCLLLLIECTEYTVIQSLDITTASGLLYGANNVQWVRLSSVESLHSGEVMLGTVDSQGSYFETLISLATRTILAVWDTTSTRSNKVVTGEIMASNPDLYTGSPLAPQLNAPAATGTRVSLTWAQQRSDLVTGFEVQASSDGEDFQFLSLVNSGQVLGTTTEVLMPGVSYTFRVRALSLDGSSPWSNTAGIQL